MTVVQELDQFGLSRIEGRLGLVVGDEVSLGSGASNTNDEKSLFGKKDGNTEDSRSHLFRGVEVLQKELKNF